MFKRSTGNFVTTCQLTPKEDAELKTTGNLGGNGREFSWKAKNLPPDQTPVTTFENGAMSINPSMNTDESRGFTSTNSFASDILEVTPIDGSQLDNQ